MNDWKCAREQAYTISSGRLLMLSDTTMGASSSALPWNCSHELLFSWMAAWLISGRRRGQQLSSFQSPVVHWMAWTSLLNCLSCRSPYQALPHFHWKRLFWIAKCFIAFTSPKSAPIIVGRLFWRTEFPNCGWRFPTKEGVHWVTRKRAEYCFKSTVRERELTEFCVKLGEFCKKRGELAVPHTNNRPRGAHQARSPELGKALKNSQSSVFETVLSETVFGPFLIHMNSNRATSTWWHFVTGTALFQKLRLRHFLSPTAKEMGYLCDETAAKFPQNI